MAMHVPKYIESMVPYVPGKPIEETQREFNIKKVVKLASNENPLGPSPKAILAARKALKETHRYPDGSAYSLKQILASQLDVAPSQIIVGQGSNEIIDLLIRTYCQPGDAIITSQAAFVAYRLCAQISGVRTLEAPLTSDLRFDLPAMLKLLKGDDRARLLFVANPNNPTGTYVTTDELRSFLRGVRDVRDGEALVVLDYAYWEYVTARDLPDAIDLLREFPEVVVLRTFSKIHGLAGFRIGYGVATESVIREVEKVRQPFNINSLGLAAAEAALQDEAFVARSRKMNRQGMEFWEKALKKLSIPFWKSQGNFLLADVQEGLGESGPEVYQACLRKGVIFRPVANYGMSHALRISVGLPSENAFAARVLRELYAGKIAIGAKTTRKKARY